ncbi:unnamed protein product [Trichogramma brassicae]|uniref:Uncharacterized protein n=1 Tax=Trichogramma brassicae TaxID=86971 RepID=A0A6H5J0H9_9HYME|nr:unnamed protein product [Trichogramma brassicae]
MSKRNARYYPAKNASQANSTSRNDRGTKYDSDKSEADNRLRQRVSRIWRSLSGRLKTSRVRIGEILGSFVSSIDSDLATEYEADYDDDHGNDFCSEHKRAAKRRSREAGGCRRPIRDDHLLRRDVIARDDRVCCAKFQSYLESRVRDSAPCLKARERPVPATRLIKLYV